MEVLKDLRRAGKVVAVEGDFTKKSNPLLRKAGAITEAPAR